MTISIGEEFEFIFFKILACVSSDVFRVDMFSDNSQVLTGITVIMWLVIAVRTIKGALSGKMFFAPCLGTDLFLKKTGAGERKPARH